jgi:23S rRNA (cytosine1962-C5)-methyltransferase
MSYPQIQVAPSAAKRIRHYDCWVFRDELIARTHPLANGEVVELTDRHSAFLAYAFYSTHSHIAARVVSTDRARPVDRALLSARLTMAMARRRAVLNTNAKRLVFSEADGLPGLIVDQYADYLVLQIRAAGMDAWKPVVVDLLRDAVHPHGILEHSDKEFREQEGLPAITQVLSGIVPGRIRIEEDDLQFWVDPYHGQKTGFYLDQRETRRRVRELIRPGERFVDVCAYTGAFGIGAASRGAHVICVEQDESSIALAKDNATLNQLEDRIEFVVGDAFYWLEAKAASPKRFDWVLLDPPSLAKSKTEILKGRQALHHLLVQALGLLAAEGTLVLSVCTYHLLELAEEILRIAAAQRGMRLRVRGLSMQAMDHPWILQMPMTRYLRSWMAQRDGSPAA